MSSIISPESTNENPTNLGRFTITPRGQYKRPAFEGKPHWFIAFLIIVENAEYRPNPNRFKLGWVWQLNTGQLATSLNDLKRQFVTLGMSCQNIPTFLRHLKNHRMINIITNKGGMVITICNYIENHQRTKRTNTQSGLVSNLHPNNVYNKQRVNKNYKQTHYNGRELPPIEQEVMANFRAKQQEMLAQKH